MAPYSLQEKTSTVGGLRPVLGVTLVIVLCEREGIKKMFETSRKSKKHVPSARYRLFSNDLEIQVAGLFIRLPAAE